MKKPLEQVARELARERGTSIVILEIRREGPRSMFCEDCASLFEDDGRAVVLYALRAALQGMHANAERELRELAAAEKRKRSGN